MNRSAGLARVLLPPVVFGLAFVALWEVAVKAFDLKPYFLPAPTSIWDQFRGNTGLIWGAASVSGGNALIGLVAGTVLGVALSFVLARFRILN